MDLPLATPELDHDALRETLSSYSTTVRDKGYSPPPTKSWQRVFSVPSKEVCPSTSTVTRQPRLSACNENLANNFLHPEQAYFPVLPRTRELQNTLFSSRDCSFDSALFADLLALLASAHKLPLSFLSQQGCVGLNPQLVVRSGSLTDGYSAPSPH
jgi:hypothetical protein